MRFGGLLGVAVMVVCPLVCEGETTAAADDVVQKEIRQVLQQRLDALKRGDLEGYSAFVAEPFVGVNAHGQLLDKPAFIKDVRPDNARHEQSTETDVLVRSFGDAAVASYHQSVVDLVRDELGITETYVKTKGRWLLAARQETSVPFANHPPAKVDPVLYDEYIGDYRITPSRIVTITREGGKLYEKWSPDDSKVEDVPLSERTFVQRGEANVLTFERDASGKVARLVVHFNNDDLVGTKIK